MTGLDWEEAANAVASHGSGAHSTGTRVIYVRVKCCQVEEGLVLSLQRHCEEPPR